MCRLLYMGSLLVVRSRHLFAAKIILVIQIKTAVFGSVYLDGSGRRETDVNLRCCQ